MKVTMEFCPVEDKMELEAAMKATDMWLVLKNVLKIVEKDRNFYEEHNKGEGENALKSIHHQIYSEITNNGLDNLIFNY